MHPNHSNRDVASQIQSGSLVLAVQILSIISIFLLMISSHRLWIPKTGSNFPEVPALAVANSPSAVWDYGALLLLVFGLTSLLWLIARSLRQSEPRSDSAPVSSAPRVETHSLSQGLWWSVIVAGIVLVVLNQHRLQAWFYHLLIFSLIFTLKHLDEQLKWLRRIVVSVYIYSALGKLDFEFVHTVGQDFLAALAGLFGLSVDDWAENDRIVVTLLFPIIELAIGLGLAIHKTRRASGVVAILFHLTLATLVFGPLKHSWGVFLWNLQFALQAMLLFAWQSTAADRSESNAMAKNKMQGAWLERIVRIVLFAVMFLPLGERMGYWDHWPSWGLYAPHSSRVRVTVARFAVQQLPESLQQVLSDEELDEPEVELPLARWSFRELGVPIYPQARFQLGVARRIAESLESEFAIRVEIRSSADRFTGERKAIILNGSRETRQTAGPFWLGSWPRQSN